MTITLRKVSPNSVPFEVVKSGETFIEDRDGTEILFLKIIPVSRHGEEYNAVKLNFPESRPHSKFTADEMVVQVVIKEILVKEKS